MCVGVWSRFQSQVRSLRVWPSGQRLCGTVYTVGFNGMQSQGLKWMCEWKIEPDLSLTSKSQIMFSVQTVILIELAQL